MAWYFVMTMNLEKRKGRKEGGREAGRGEGGRLVTRRHSFGAGQNTRSQDWGRQLSSGAPWQTSESDIFQEVVSFPQHSK